MIQTGGRAPRSLRQFNPALLRRAFHLAADKIVWLNHLRLVRRRRRMMREALGYQPNLHHPRSFNERIAWKILHDRNPLIPLTLDKVAVRPWAAERIGGQYITPIVGVWDSAGEIPWAALPQRFVLKANHGSGYNILVPDKALACRGTILAQAEAWLAENYGEQTGEWGYRSIQPRLLIEEFLPGSAGGAPEDYKVYVFGGRPYLLQVHLGRFTEQRRELFYNPITLKPLAFGRHRHADWPDYPGPPPAAAALYDLAARLGAGFDAVRVDFYLIDGEPRFGEMTHYSGGSSVALGTPDEDRTLGDLWAEANGKRTTPKRTRAINSSALAQLLQSVQKIGGK
ncbi:ATP-grasp fold amidoligase family protein [Belnapia sp. F-4-1]|uniref:ATP-grasp fold amidoligase family protein n=1 Tax=Belnapia sp. F-4-1 TaxID=1545443 RepID=UPI001186C29A|nr:ATP-grasp fold amidoligase family protein [Belnapia sp. F-4-1]